MTQCSVKTFPFCTLKTPKSAPDSHFMNHDALFVEDRPVMFSVVMIADSPCDRHLPPKLDANDRSRNAANQWLTGVECDAALL